MRGTRAALDVASGGPLYQQLRQELFARIRRGDLGPGARLPSENELCESYGVSVTTARRALLELVKEGVVQRRPGVGTMVAPRVREARLAFVSIDYRDDAWWSTPAAMGELIAGIGALTWTRHAAFSMSGVPEEDLTAHLRTLVATRSTDGLLLRTANDIWAEPLDILDQGGMPYVVVKRELVGRPMNCVVSDDEVGARLATRHLLERGHRRIGFVCAKPSLKMTQERLSGYRQALADAGIGFDPALVRLELTFDQAAGKLAVASLLQRESRPTAIFIASDTMAIGGYEAARDLGLTIPDDVALVGYDDIGPASLLDPPLTTVRTAFEDFGRLATQLLLDLVDGRLEAPQRVVIAPKLVVRQSTGEPAATVRPAPVVARRRGNLLAGKRIAVVGGEDVLAERIAAAVGDAGGDCAPAALGSDKEQLDGAVWTVDLRQGIEAGLTAATTEANALAGRMARRLSGSLVLAARSPSAGETPALASAAAAGFKQAIRGLSGAWSPRGVRVNGILASDDDPSVVLAPSIFLLSDAGASLSGQCLRTDEGGRV